MEFYGELKHLYFKKMKIYKTINEEPKIYGIYYIRFMFFVMMVMIFMSLFVEIAGKIFGLIGGVGFLYALFKGLQAYERVDKIRLKNFIKSLMRFYKTKISGYEKTQKVKII